jgi:hypothetical protein
MKKIIWILVLTVLVACSHQEKGIEVKIENQSDFPITEVEFYTSQKISLVEFQRVEAGKSVSGFLSMKENTTDGNYVLGFRRNNGEKELRHDGYYTNGFPSAKRVIFEVQNDTVHVKYDESY